MKKKPRYIQVRNPRTGIWIRIDRHNGIVVGKRKRKYSCPSLGKC